MSGSFYLVLFITSLNFHNVAALLFRESLCPWIFVHKRLYHLYLILRLRIWLVLDNHKEVFNLTKKILVSFTYDTENFNSWYCPKIMEICFDEILNVKLRHCKKDSEKVNEDFNFTEETLTELCPFESFHVDFNPREALWKIIRASYDKKNLEEMEMVLKAKKEILESTMRGKCEIKLKPATRFRLNARDLYDFVRNKFKVNNQIIPSGTKTDLVFESLKKDLGKKNLPEDLRAYNAMLFDFYQSTIRMENLKAVSLLFDLQKDVFFKPWRDESKLLDVHYLSQWETEVMVGIFIECHKNILQTGQSKNLEIMTGQGKSRAVQGVLKNKVPQILKEQTSTVIRIVNNDNGNPGIVYFEMSLRHDEMEIIKQ